MKITITKTKGLIPVTILHLEGKLDRANYESLIEEAQDVYGAGNRDLLLDLERLTFISSAGLAALHQVALLFRGEEHPFQDEGWAAYRAINRDRERGAQEHVKLLSPTKEVREVLDMTGFGSLFEIFIETHQALASFRQPAPVSAASLP
jgi:anti-anti-sigma regulatory factor